MGKVNNKQRREIAYALSTYIFKRLWANRELQNLCFLNNQDQIVDLDDLCEVLELQQEAVEQIRLREDSNNWVEILVKNNYIEKLAAGTIDYRNQKDNVSYLVGDALAKPKKQFDESVNRIMEEAINFVINEYGSDQMRLSYYKAMVRVLDYLKEKVSKRVIFSRENIKDIRKLVEYCVERCDIENFGCSNENELLRKMLRKIIATSKDKKMKELAQKYFAFFCCNGSAGFDSKISGSINFGDGDIITIENENGKTLFRMDKEGSIKKNYIESEDYVLFGRDIVCGHRLNEQGKIISDIGRLIIDNNKFFFHSILLDDKVYPLIAGQYSEIKPGYVSNSLYLKALLEQLGLEDYYCHVYNERDLTELVQLINEHQKTTEEDIKKYEEIGNRCAEWWSNAVSNPSFNAGFDGVAGIMLELCGNAVVRKNPNTQESLEKFRQLLKRKIVMKLIQNEYLCLSVDYGPCQILAECAEEAGINGIFPLKTVMKIYRNEARVSEGYGNCPQILYSEKPSRGSQGNAKLELK